MGQGAPNVKRCVDFVTRLLDCTSTASDTGVNEGNEKGNA